MEEVIFLICALLAIIVYIFLSSHILSWISNKILINGLNFKKSLKIILILGVIGLFIVIIRLGWIIILVSFPLFHYLIQYYQKEKIKILQTLKVFIIFGLIGFMNQTLNDGDYLMVKEFDRNFKRGDIVVMRNPLNASQYFIERIIGLPNEVVVINGGKIYINNDLLKEDYIASETAGDISVDLSSQQYYVMGDNRMASLDSRKFGPVPYKHIIGKIFFKSELVKKFLKYYEN